MNFFIAEPALNFVLVYRVGLFYYSFIVFYRLRRIEAYAPILYQERAAINNYLSINR